MKVCFIFIAFIFISMKGYSQNSVIFFNAFELVIPDDYSILDSSESRMVYQSFSGVTLSVSYGEKEAAEKDLFNIGNSTMSKLKKTLVEFGLVGSGSKVINGYMFYKFGYSFTSNNFPMYGQMLFASLNDQLFIASFGFLDNNRSKILEENDAIIHSFRKVAK